MFKFLYDLLVWITNNYSKMPSDFQKRFPENFCVRGRLDLGSLDETIIKNWIDYE